MANELSTREECAREIIKLLQEKHKNGIFIWNKAYSHLLERFSGMEMEEVILEVETFRLIFLFQ